MPASASAGTVLTNGNYYAGVWIQQTAGTAAVELTGLVSYANVAGQGVRVFGGSALKLRKSVLLSNAGNGVLVTTNVVGNVRVNDVSRIDLGTTADYGKNVLQSVLGFNPNLGVGVCLALDAGTARLAAAGNSFAGLDCSQNAPGAVTRNNGCGNHADIGITTLGNDINVANCTHP